MKRCICFLCIFCNVSFTLFAQEQRKLVHSLTHQFYGTKEGLNQSQVFYSFQDSYGYIWSVTHGDVSRFDGKEFRTFTRSELGNGAIIKYVNQYKNALFFISRDCISFMYPDERIEKYPMPDDYKTDRGWWMGFATMDNHLYLSNCYQTEEDHANNYTVFCFDLEHKTFKKLREGTPHLSLCITDHKLMMLVHSNSGGNYSTEGLLTLTDEDEFISVPVKGVLLKDNYDYQIRESLSDNELFLLERPYKSSKKEHCIYSCRFSEDTLCCNLLYSLADHINLIQQIDENRIFLGWDNNYILDTEHGEVQPFPVNTLIVNHVISDRDGNLWLSTEEGIINCHRLLFDSYKLGIKHNDYIWDVCKDHFDNIWFSSYGLGFWRADQKGNLTQAGIFEKGKRRMLDFGYMGHAEDRSGRTYLASGEGIVIFDPQKGNRTVLESFKTGTSLAVYYDSLTNYVYAGGYDYAKDGEFSTLCRINEKLEIQTYRFGSKHVICICRDADRRLRIGTFRGEYVFDEKEGIFIEDTVQHPYAGVVSMSLDDKGYLWKGTTSGVFAEDKDGALIRIADNDKIISFLTCYRNKYVIWGCQDRLSVLDLQKFHQDTTVVNIRTFDGYYGFDVMECGQNGIHTDKDGYVWITGSDKVLRFFPDDLMAIPALQITPPYLAAVYNTDRDNDWQLAQNNESLIFENKSNYLRFDLLQASVMAPDKLSFRYRLRGYSDYWVKTRERSVVFQNLPHGKYHFEVQSSVDDDNWSESTLSPLITIKRPFWLTLPGLFLLLAGFILLLLFLVYWVRKFSIKKQEEKRQIERLKYRAVQSKFIPHFTGNVLNSINYLISKDPELAQKYIVDFAAFSRRTLLYSDKLMRTLKEELEYIEIYLKLEKLRFEEDLDYAFYSDPEVDPKTMVPMMALQTFCENAIKHGLHHKGAPGFIKIEVLKNNEYIILAVEDDGIGREKARELKTEGSREGLNIVNEQIRFFNKTYPQKAHLKIIDLYDNEKKPAGTRFELYI